MFLSSCVNSVHALTVMGPELEINYYCILFDQSVGRNDLMILASGVRIPLWDVDASLSDETV
jgi:hypothetical protein